MPNTTRGASPLWLRLVLHTALLAFVASMAAGCGLFSPDEGGGDGGGGGGEVTFPLATTPDQLIKNFENAHRVRNFEQYDNLLAEEFEFWFAPDDIGTIGQGQNWGRSEDTQSTNNMFRGETGNKPDGTPVPAVQSITINLSKLEDWADAGGEVVGGITEVPAGALRARYTVDMIVNYTTGDVTSQISGEQLFYAVPTLKDLGDGNTTTEWKLLIWRDFGNTTAGS